MVVRERFQRQAMDLLFTLAAYHERLGDYERAMVYAQRQIELEPWCEEAHQQVIRALAFDGQRSGALIQYHTCCQMLAVHLDVAPTPRPSSCIY